jgi:hypothetical protein
MVIYDVNLNTIPSEGSGVKHGTVVQLCSIERAHLSVLQQQTETLKMCRNFFTFPKYVEMQGKHHFLGILKFGSFSFFPVGVWGKYLTFPLCHHT